MSSLIVEVSTVDTVTRHPNADAMEVVHVKGWQVCTKLGQFQAGDRCIYIPPDSILPGPLADRLGVTKYLVPLPKDATRQRPTGGRIRVARLRGVASYGLLMDAHDDPTWPIGTDVAIHYGITKYEPPPDSNDGETASDLPVFHRYSNIENFRNFPYAFAEGEEVLFTEKIHGMNSRVGLAQTPEGPTFVAGSHSLRRKEVDHHGKFSRFWEPLTPTMKELLVHLAEGGQNVVVFGEIFGSGVQDMTYGCANGLRTFRAFDVAVNGQYLDYDVKLALFARFGIAMVPTLYRGPFSRQVVEQYCEGPTTVCDPTQAGKHTFREGIVIVPTRERFCDALPGGGRLILKAINPDYLTRKDGTEFH